MRDGMTGEFELVPKDQAKVSVFDSCFLLGDGLWEGIRANRGSIQFAKVSVLDPLCSVTTDDVAGSYRSLI